MLRLAFVGMPSVVLCFLPALPWGPSGVSRAQGDETAHCWFYLEGMRDGRMRLRQGEVAIQGHLKRKSNGEILNPIKIKQLFDYDQSLWWFDHETGIPEGSTLRFQAATSKEGTFTWSPVSEYNARRIHWDHRGSVKLASFQPINMRAWGLEPWYSIVGSTKSLDDLVDDFKAREGKVRKIRPGVYALNYRWEVNQSSQPFIGESELWVDESKGFVLTYSALYSIDSFSDGREIRVLHAENHISWTNLDGIELPAKSTFVYRLGEEMYVADLVFDWKSVNRPIDETRFSPDGFDLQGYRGVALLDQRSGRPVFVRRLPDQPIQPVEVQRPWRWWIYLAGIVGLLAIFAFAKFLPVIWKAQK